MKEPANLFNQALADLRLDGWLTLIAMTYVRLGDLFVLLGYPDQLQGASREFNAQLETASYRKMKDWRILFLQYLLQQNKIITGEDKVATGARECKQYCDMPLLTDLAVMMRINPLALVHRLRGFVHGGVRTRDVICVTGRASGGIQELGVICQLSLGCGLFRAELGGTEGAERVGQ